jgi:hypothetical protein
MLVKNLQRAAVDVVGAAETVGRGPTLKQREPHAPARQLGGKHQAGGPTTDDRDVELRDFTSRPTRFGGHRHILIHRSTPGTVVFKGLAKLLTPGSVPDLPAAPRKTTR